ncbi:hypothetical protein DPMN_175770 [Dreissena polymorpha]|uniref:Uncharacterized protein n=1 Tax=Dreissena polymorpha TaxID=45954 RepID=A0A9D4E7W7_DREPO|nr:hypothetical protein DPMN_175770 [Dreissena polymorpha]
MDTCVHDNVRNMECAGDKCDEWGNLGCFGHTLQLCVKPALELASVSKTIARCRRLILVTSSTQQQSLQKLKNDNRCWAKGARVNAGRTHELELHAAYA